MKLTAIWGQMYCESSSDNQWIFGGPENDDTTDIFGGSIITFLPEFKIQRIIKASFQTQSFAEINTPSGNLLMYTNGCDLFDKRDSLIKNGSGLNPGEIYDDNCPGNFGYPGLHNMFFLPSAYDTSIYYLFHIGEIYNYEPDAFSIIQFDKFYITTVHATMDNGYPEVIDKNKVIFADTGMLGMPSSAVRHANGLDWWIITPVRWINGFHTILLDELAAHYRGIQNVGKVTHPDASGGQGKFSPDGSVFAWYQPRNGLFLYDFDRTTGLLSNFRSVEVPVAADLLSGGLEFSPSGRFLYVNHYFSLYQVDMHADDLQASLTHIADYDGFGSSPFFTTFYHLERTPDKRIFMNPRTGSQWLHVIQEPEKKGIACRFEQHIIQLPTVNNYSFPHFPNYRLGALGEPLCDSMIVSVPNPMGVVTSPCHIYPNPTTTSSTIYLPTQWSEAMVYTVDGLLIGKNKSNQNEFPLTLDLADWSPGIYFIEGVDRDGQRCVDKLIIH